MTKSLIKCSECNQYGWKDSHECPPRWSVLFPEFDDDEDSAHVVHADSAEKAVEVAAAISDAQGDYEIVSGGETKARVRRYEEPDSAVSTISWSASHVWQNFVVEGYTVPKYTATKGRTE